MTTPSSDDVNSIVQGLSGPGASMVLLCVVLVGVGYLAKVFMTQVMERFSQHLTIIETLFKDLSGSLQGVKSEITQLRTTIEGIANDQKRIEAEIDNIKDRVRETQK